MQFQKKKKETLNKLVNNDNISRLFDWKSEQFF